MLSGISRVRGRLCPDPRISAPTRVPTDSPVWRSQQHLRHARCERGEKRARARVRDDGHAGGQQHHLGDELLDGHVRRPRAEDGGVVSRSECHDDADAEGACRLDGRPQEREIVVGNGAECDVDERLSRIVGRDRVGGARELDGALVSRIGTVLV